MNDIKSVSLYKASIHTSPGLKGLLQEGRSQWCNKYRRDQHTNPPEDNLLVDVFSEGKRGHLVMVVELSSPRFMLGLH